MSSSAKPRARNLPDAAIETGVTARCPVCDARVDVYRKKGDRSTMYLAPHPAAPPAAALGYACVETNREVTTTQLARSRGAA